jgi:hypothetical protein
MSTPKTLQVFLPQGSPSGIRIAELTTRIVQAVACPRTGLDALFERQESKHVATYFLLGGSDEDTKAEAYIGQTEDLVARLKSHDANKEFWHTVVFWISRTHSFTQAHIRWLEWKAIASAKAANRYNLTNGNAGSEPFATEAMLADLGEIFETGAILLESLGHPIFRPFVEREGSESTTSSTTEWQVKGPEASAKGIYTSDGFVVMEGSHCRKEVVPSAKDTFVTTKRDQLLANGILKIDGAQLVFTEDCPFNSPSGAAMVVLGRTANGWNEWKNESGQSLDQIRQQQAAAGTVA